MSEPFATRIWRFCGIIDGQLEPAWGPKYAHLVRTRAYIGGLPRGIGSYPECRSKASVWRNIVKWTDMRPVAGRIPDELGFIEHCDLLDGALFPTTHNFIGHLVLRDCCFTSDEAMCEHFRMLDRRLLSSPLYRMLFAFISPQMVANAADRRFSALFEGIVLKTLSSEPNRTRLKMTYPPAVMPALVARLYLIAFEVAIELAGASDIVGRVLNFGNTSTEYELSWK